ncbi:MAG: FmdE family protein [Desulfatiglans sp.]|nr:FmdE family protein [Thermodesulfobacteriota bacterium]MEE4351398.1 FmdE family protein [Desulfatiglans sp.]
MDPTYDDLIAFHGHSCPGLAMGYRMSKAAMNLLSSSRAEDEEIVAIVENNACGVDALQCLSGCTFGKGNFIFKDYGKHVYTLYNRRSRKGVRVVFNPQDIPDNVRDDKDRFIEWLLNAPEQDILSLKEVEIAEPEPARIMNSLICEFCGEAVMETRTREIDHRLACIPCAERETLG